MVKEISGRLLWNDRRATDREILISDEVYPGGHDIEYCIIHSSASPEGIEKRIRRLYKV